MPEYQSVTRSWYFEIMNRHAAIYVRISSDRTGAGLGTQRQIKECRELAERLGWTVTEIYDDNDESAYQRRKPRAGWVNLLDDLRSGHVDAVLAWHVDRLYRRPRDLDELIEIIEKRGTPVQTVTAGTLDLSTPAGIAMAKTAAVFAEYESSQKAIRQRSKARELAEAGKVGGGGTRPFGFESDFRTVRESEADLIRQATHAILRGGMGIRALCADWNQAGVLTVTGKRWTPHVMRRMLMSARISGRREHHKVITQLKAEWPAIITAEDSDRLRVVLGDPARRTNETTGRRYLLTGYLYCGLPGCEDKMKARAQGDHQRSYVCADIGRAHLRILAEPLELFVREAVLDYLDEFVDLAAAVKAASEGDGEASLWRSVVDYQARLDELETGFWVDRKMTERTYQRLRSELEGRIESLRIRLARIDQRHALSLLPTSSAIARERWEAAGLQWRRRLIQLLVEKVTIGPGVRGRNRFDPTRIRITFRVP